MYLSKICIHQLSFICQYKSAILVCCDILDPPYQWTNQPTPPPPKLRESLLTVELFKASALWADAFYKSKCPSVCLSVCLSVCSLLRYHLTVFLPPIPKVGGPIFLEIRNPWGKVMERTGLTFEHFCLEVDFALQNMVETTLPDGSETSGRRAYR